MIARMRPLKIGLPFVALVVASFAVAILLMAPMLEVTLPAPGKATDAQAVEIYDQLLAAIRSNEHEQAKQLAAWLDDRLAAQGKTTPLPHSRIVEVWCEMGGHGYEFCKEGNDAKQTGQ